MPYLEACLSETLRIFPTIARVDRQCENDYQLTDQVTIPAGTTVFIPIHANHYDPENFEDPDQFKPER